MSPRARARLIVAFVALAAAGVVVGGALLQGRAGETQTGAKAARTTLPVDPDSPAALEAETLRHPEMAPGRPPFVANLPVPRALAGKPFRIALPVLERQAKGGGARQWLLYGSFLQRAGRPVSARRAFDEALALAPDDLAAQTAAAVARFDKDDPSAAFSRLGPLARDHPRAQVVRYHLGLMLLWLRQVAGARRQLVLAKEVAPRTFYGLESQRLLAKLQGI